MSDAIRRYTAGFLFVDGEVMLVRKTHPAWQAGLMNGIGGEVEGEESVQRCMSREFAEETGWHINEWDYFARETGPGYEVHFFRYTMNGCNVKSVQWPHNDRGEELEWCDANNIKYPVIGNLHWLIPLALDPRPIECVIKTTGDIRSIVTW